MMGSIPNSFRCTGPSIPGVDIWIHTNKFDWCDMYRSIRIQYFNFVKQLCRVKVKSIRLCK